MSGINISGPRGTVTPTEAQEAPKAEAKKPKALAQEVATKIALGQLPTAPVQTAADFSPPLQASVVPLDAKQPEVLARMEHLVKIAVSSETSADIGSRGAFPHELIDAPKNVIVFTILPQIETRDPADRAPSAPPADAPSAGAPASDSTLAANALTSPEVAAIYTREEDAQAVEQLASTIADVFDRVETKDDGEVVLPSPDFVKLESAYHALPSSLAGMDIEQLATIVMFQIAAEKDKDLRSIMDKMHQVNANKAALREYATKAKEEKTRVTQELREEYDERTKLPPNSPLFIDASTWSFDNYKISRQLETQLATPGEVLEGGAAAPDFTPTEDWPIQARPVQKVADEQPDDEVKEQAPVGGAQNPLDSPPAAVTPVTTVSPTPPVDPDVAEADAMVAAHAGDTPPLTKARALELIALSKEYKITGESMYSLDRIRVEMQPLASLNLFTATKGDLKTFLDDPPPQGLGAKGKSPGEIKTTAEAFIASVKTYGTAHATAAQYAEFKTLMLDAFYLDYAVTLYGSPAMKAFPMPTDLQAMCNAAKKKLDDFKNALGPLALQDCATEASRTVDLFWININGYSLGNLPTVPGFAIEDRIADAVAHNSDKTTAEALSAINDPSSAWNGVAQKTPDVKAFQARYETTHDVHRSKDAKDVMSWKELVVTDIENTARQRGQACAAIAPWPFADGNFVLTVEKRSGSLPLIAHTGGVALTSSSAGRAALERFSFQMSEVETSARAPARSTLAVIDDSIETLDDAREKLSEMSEEMQLEMQIAMDQRQKAFQTLSNLLKKMSDTRDTIIANTK